MFFYCIMDFKKAHKKKRLRVQRLKCHRQHLHLYLLCSDLLRSHSHPIIPSTSLCVFDLSCHVNPSSFSSLGMCLMLIHDW